MGLVLRCDECSKTYRTLEQLETLRDNESICLRCRALIEVDDWDELLITWEESDEEAEDDFDDVEIDVDVAAEKEEEADEEHSERSIDLIDEEGAFPGTMESLDDATEDEEDDDEEDDE